MQRITFVPLLPLAPLALAFGGDPGASAPAASAPAEAEVARAAEPAEPAPGPDALQIRAKTIFLGDGNRIEDGVVLIDGGTIRSIGRGVEIDPDLPVLTHDGVLTAGMIAAHSWFGAEDRNYDAARPILPEARVAHGVRAWHSDFRKALEQGITTMVVAPTGLNVVGGRTCALKTTGALLDAEAHLALSFSKEALGQGQQSIFFFFGADGEPRTAALEDGFEESGGSANGARLPTSYAGAVAALEREIAAGNGPFAEIRGGGLPVLLEAWDRNEVARAVAFARRHGLSGAVRGAPLAADLIPMLSESGLGVVLGPFDAGAPTRSLEGAAALAEAGVRIAFSLGASGTNPAAARFAAASAVVHGLDPIDAWKALSSDAARLAGVGDRVGRLEKGMDADLVLWSGDPIDLSSRVETVFVDGKRVFGGKR